MSAGKEAKSKRQSCIANKDGFVSAYALALLCIILSFVSLCVLQIQVCAALLQENKQHEMELALIHHIQTNLQKAQAEETQANNEHEGNEKTEKKEEASPQEVNKENFHYKEMEARILYEDDHITVEYQNKQETYQMIVLINEHKEIIDIEYS